MFQVADNQIKAPDGSVLTTLHTEEWQGQEVVVFEKSNTCNEFIVFYLKRYYVPMFSAEVLSYSTFQIDPSTNQLSLIDDGIDLQKNEIGYDVFGGLAVSKEKADGSRDLYYAFMKDGNSGSIQKYTINANGTVSSATEVFSGFYTGSGINDNFHIAELEISPNGEKLAFSRLNRNSYGNQDVVVFDRNQSTGNLSNATVIELKTNDQLYNYPGIEFDQNSEYLYVIGDGNDGRLYIINTANNNVEDEINILPENSHSMLELGRDGKFYVASANKLMKMDVYGNFTDFITNAPMAKNEHLFGATLYLLPDQIDGRDYIDYIAPTECCYTWETTPASDAMQGVQIQTNGDDRNIIIQSGNNVTWAPEPDGNNPFGGVTEAYMEKGDIIIEPGASLTIEDMIIHFRDGYEIQMDDNPSGVGSRLELENTTLTVFDECEGDKLWAGIDFV